MNDNLLSSLILSPSTIEEYSDEDKALVFGDYAHQLGKTGIEEISKFHHVSPEYVVKSKDTYGNKQITNYSAVARFVVVISKIETRLYKLAARAKIPNLFLGSFLSDLKTMDDIMREIGRMVYEKYRG